MSDPADKALAKAAEAIQLGGVRNLRGMALYFVNAAQVALGRAQTFAELKNIHDEIRRVEAYYKAAQGMLEEANYITAQRIRTVRHVGRMLSSIERNGGGRPPKTGNSSVTSFQEAVKELGISRQTAQRYQILAEIPEGEFLAWLNELENSQSELTTWSILARWQAKRNKVLGVSPSVHTPSEAPDLDSEAEVRGDYTVEYDIPTYNAIMHNVLVECSALFQFIAKETDSWRLRELAEAQRTKIEDLFREMAGR